MNICLVSARMVFGNSDVESTIDDYKNRRDQLPLSMLCLAAVLSAKGITPHIVHLDQLFIDFIRLKKSRESLNFLTFVVEHFKSFAIKFNVFGLGTICSSYPLTLRIAKEIKRLNPNALIILGGPQASIVDISTLGVFPFIDIVIRGEADNTFPLLIDTLSEAKSPLEFDNIPGITFRRGTDIIRNPNAPLISDLDLLPMPSFHLDPNLKENDHAYLKIGRGCPYDCIFCSTNDFFGRKYRLKSVQKMIKQMKYLDEMYGIRKIDLIHDMFTANRKYVVAFCEALLKCDKKFTWGCSTRTDNIDDELIALMAKAGCDGIFFGIETGSERLQRVIKKKLNLSEAAKRIRYADQQGMQTVVSLITAFPDETMEDLRDTINFIVDSHRLDNVEPQLVLLAPQAGTLIYNMHKDELIFDNIFSDLTRKGLSQDTEAFELARNHPDIFQNFFAIPTSKLDRRYFNDVRNFVEGITSWFRWLPVALLQDGGDLLKIFDRWKTWLAEKRSDDLISEVSEVTDLYFHMNFPRHLIEFVHTCYNNEMATSPAAISAVIECEIFSLNPEHEAVQDDLEELEDFKLTSFPYQPLGLHIRQFNLDYKELLKCLRNNWSLERVSIRNMIVAFREKIDQGKMILEVRILSSLAEELLHMCTGKIAVSDIIHQFSMQKADVNGVPANKVCFIGLNRLFEQGLICLSSGPVR